MLDNMIERIVTDKLKVLSISDKLTGYFVKKKRRGTYQALQASNDIEKDIHESIIQYIKEWLTHELMDGKVRKELEKQVQSQVELELSSRGYDKIKV